MQHDVTGLSINRAGQRAAWPARGALPEQRRYPLPGPSRRFPRLVAWLWLVLACCGLFGCAQTISREGLARVDGEVPFSWLRESPEDHLGQTFVLGGAIIETENHPEKTVLVVLHHGLGFARKPDPQRGSEGRFLVQVREFLDPAIFRPGRLVTVLGEVVGEETRSLQDRTYVYPVIAGSEVHLWPDADQLPERTRFHFGFGVGIGL